MVQVNNLSAPGHPLIESDRVEGTSVYSVDGKQVGTIERLVIEKVSGHVVYAITTFGGFLGVGAEKHTIPWEQLHFDKMLGGYKTSITGSQLRDAPEFARQDDPLLSGHEREELSQYYSEL
jgi:sporulation protein YlmC with PRC-barrel domain